MDLPAKVPLVERARFWLEAAVNDLRQGLRRLAASPGFATVAMLTLALGIGICASVFSIVETVLLRPLPFRDPQELVNVEFSALPEMTGGRACSVPELDDLRLRSGVFAEVSMVFPMDGNITGVAEPQRVEALAVSPGYFRLLGTKPTLGRTFGAEEERVPGWAQGCVLSYRAWMNYFGGDPGILGRVFYMDYDTFRVIGVMPPGFRHPGRTLTTEVDVWFTGGLRSPPFTATPQRGHRIIPGVLGRLAPGQSLATSQEKLERFADLVRSENPRDYSLSERWTPRLRSLQEALTGNVRPTLWLLFGAVVLVLLICCATVANLMLLRATRRRAEIALRCALGASRSDLVRPLLVESLLVFGAGALGGLLLAWLLPPVLLRHAPASVAQLNEVAVNGPVLAFSLLAALGTGCVFGLLPAARAAKVDLVSDLKAGERAVGLSPSVRRWQLWLVVGQTALSVVLLAGAGLLLRSFYQVLQTDPGFRAEQVVTGRIWLPPPTDQHARQSYLSHANRVALMRELLRRFAGLPSVESVAWATDVPLTGTAASVEILLDSGQSASPLGASMLRTSVTPGYFHVLGIPLLRGRGFTEADDGRAPVALVNAAAARRYWPDGDPLGRRIGRSYGGKVQWYSVVGVVGNAKSGALEAADSPHIYFPAYQDSALGLAFFVRFYGVVPPSNAALREEIRRADADLPVYELLPLGELVARSRAPRAFVASVIGGFAGVSLFLAALGLYGVIAMSVSQRRREFAVRFALGARREDLMAAVFGRGLKLACLGLLLGVAAGMTASLALRAALFEVSPLDPLTWCAVAVLLLVVAAAACWGPARRAANLDPNRVLQGD